jgi:hypothetical protein
MLHGVYTIVGMFFLTWLIAGLIENDLANINSLMTFFFSMETYLWFFKKRNILKGTPLRFLT